MLLLLTGAFVPNDIVDYLSGMTFSAFSFNFIPIVDIPYYNHFALWLDYEQDDENLEILGVESGSAFTNNFSLLNILLLLVVLAGLNKCIPSDKNNSEPTKTQRCYRYLRTSFDKFACYAVLIRMVIEGMHFILLSSVSETFRLQTHSFARVVSILIAASMILFYFAVISFALYLVFGKLTLVQTIASRFSEFF